MNQKREAFSALTKKGALEILSCLFSIWRGWKEGRSESASSINKCIFASLKLSAGLKVSTRTFNDALKGLVDLCLVDKKGRNYCLSDLGLYLCPLLENIQTFFPSNRSTTPFSEEEKPRSWLRETARIIAGTSKQLLITTRWLNSFGARDVEETLLPVFEEAANRKVKIRVIADPDISERIQNILKDQCKAEIGFIPRSKLETPPKALKPVFLEDFAHVMISDRHDWLYINPHPKGGKHSGRCVADDPIIAGYLADIFESFWDLSEKKV